MPKIEPRQPHTARLKRIRAEIRELDAQLDKKRKDAVFVGMTADEVKLYEGHRERILELANELQTLGGNFLDTLTSKEYATERISRLVVVIIPITLIISLLLPTLYVRIAGARDVLPRPNRASRKTQK